VSHRARHTVIAEFKAMLPVIIILVLLVALVATDGESHSEN